MQGSTLLRFPEHPKMVTPGNPNQNRVRFSWVSLNTFTNVNFDYLRIADKSLMKVTNFVGNEWGIDITNRNDRDEVGECHSMAPTDI